LSKKRSSAFKGYLLFAVPGMTFKKNFLVIRKEKVVLNVGAASSREINVAAGSRSQRRP
jgi:hypothetical protein